MKEIYDLHQELANLIILHDSAVSVKLAFLSGKHQVEVTKIDGGYNSATIYDFYFEDGRSEKAIENAKNVIYSAGRRVPPEPVEKEEVSLPRRLTAENGAKALLIGEFHEIMEDESSPGNPFIVPVTWDTIKDIYAKIVDHYSSQGK